MCCYFEYYCQNCATNYQTILPVLFLFIGILAVLEYVGPSVPIQLLVSVDGSTGSCSDNTTHTLIQNVKLLTDKLLNDGRCTNVTKNSSVHCKGDLRSSNMIKVLEFEINSQGYDSDII